MTDDTSKKPSNTSKDALLGELESIKDLLDKYQDDDTPDSSQVPILDDIVDKNHLPNENNNEPSLLNLDNIFGDGNFFDEDDNQNDDDSAMNFDHLDDLDELDLNINIPDFTLSTAQTGAQDKESQKAEKLENFPADESVQTATDTTSSELDMNLLIQEVVDEFIPAIEAQLLKRLSQLGPETIQQLAKKYSKSS